MVRIAEVGMDMHHRLMPMRMGMTGSRSHREFVSVLMALIMGMFMTVLHRFLSMLVFMPLGQVQPAFRPSITIKGVSTK